MLNKSFIKLIRMPILTILSILLLTSTCYFVLTEVAIYEKMSDEVDKAAGHFTALGTIRHKKDSPNYLDSFYSFYSPDYANFSTVYDNTIATILNSDYIEKTDIRIMLSAYLPDINQVNIREYSRINEFNPKLSCVEGTVREIIKSSDNYILDFHITKNRFEPEKMIGKDTKIKVSNMMFEVLKNTDNRIEKEQSYLCLLQPTTGTNMYVTELSDFINLNHLESYLASSEGIFLSQMLEYNHINRHGFTAIYTSSLYMNFPFYNNKMFLSEGRDFNEKDQNDESKICIISRNLARENELKLGDKINISFHNGFASMDGKPKPIVRSYYNDFILTDSEKYEIIGIYNNLDKDLSNPYNYDDNTIFFPPEVFPFDDNQYENKIHLFSAPYLVTYKLKSAKYVNAFKEEVETLSSVDYEVYVLDNGFAMLQDMFISIKDSHITNLLFSILALILIVIFISYVYVLRRAKEIMILRLLGTPKSKVTRKIMTEICIIGTVSILFSNVISMLTIKDTFTKLYNNTIASSDSLKLILKNSSYTFNGEVDYVLKIVISCGLIILLMISTYILIGIINKKSLLKLLSNKKYR